jgi:hypothetical protein
VEGRLAALKRYVMTTCGRSSKRLFPEIPFAGMARCRGSAYWSLLVVDKRCLGMASACVKEALCAVLP